MQYMHQLTLYENLESDKVIRAIDQTKKRKERNRSQE